MVIALLSPSAALSTPSPRTLTLRNPKIPPLINLKPVPITTAAAAAAAAAAIVLLSPFPSAASSDNFHLYYGTAASAANYGGYGGNSSKKDSAEYVYLVPNSWKERLVSKVEKGTNGTDSEFFNPRKKTEKEYLTFLSGFRSLAPINAVLNNLALSDVELQDLIASAEDGVRSTEVKDGKGQVYYEYEVDGVNGHGLIRVTCAKNKLYAHFVKAPNAEWGKDEAMLRELHQSFRTVDGAADADSPPPPPS